MGILLCYELIEEKWEKKGTCLWLALSGLAFLMWMGFALKPTIAILGIACAMHMTITKQWRRGLLYSLCIVLVFSLFQISYHRVLDRMELVDQTDYDTENFPYSHWIMMGLGGIGVYNREDRQYTSSFETKEEKQQGNIDMIRSRLKSYGVTGLLAHQYAKGVATWHSGRYDMEFYLPNQPLKMSWLQRIFYPGKDGYPFYSLYCTLYHLMVLAMITISLKQGLRTRSLDSAVMWKLALFGLFLFLGIWETRPRYVMHFVPVLMFIATDTLIKNKDAVLAFLERRQRQPHPIGLPQRKVPGGVYHSTIAKP